MQAWPFKRHAWGSLVMQAARSQRHRVAGHPGNSMYPGIRAIEPILATVMGPIRAAQPIRAITIPGQ